MLSSIRLKPGVAWPALSWTASGPWTAAHLAVNILIGSVPAVWLGSHVSVHVLVAALRTTLAVVLVASGVALLAKAGTGLSGAAVVPLPVAVLALIIWTTARASQGRRRSARSRPDSARGALPG